MKFANLNAPLVPLQFFFYLLYLLLLCVFLQITLQWLGNFLLKLQKMINILNVNDAKCAGGVGALTKKTREGMYLG